MLKRTRYKRNVKSFIAKVLVKVLFIILILFFNSGVVSAQIQLNTLLTTEGLNKEGFPVTYKDEFSLSRDKGVQYYIEWGPSNQKHNISIKWFDPKDRLINYLVLRSFSDNIVRDYISFANKNQSQFIVPNLFGEYSIYLYVDQEIVAITKFKIIK